MLLSLLNFPNKSHRKIITLPSESVELAELMGIIAGDGGIGNKWQLVISLNSEKDKDYLSYVMRLIEHLFGLMVTKKKRQNQNTIIVTATSTTLVDFLIEKGAARGNKVFANLDIPLWIKRNPNYTKGFIRGLVDTDGCLYIHRHIVSKKAYSNIGFCLTSFSQNLLLSIFQVFKEFGLNPHITDRGRRIYFYSKEDVVKYLDIFGSSNPRIYNLYNQWRDARAV